MVIFYIYFLYISFFFMNKSFFPLGFNLFLETFEKNFY